jgi:hypothetical protein
MCWQQEPSVRHGRCGIEERRSWGPRVVSTGGLAKRAYINLPLASGYYEGLMSQAWSHWMALSCVAGRHSWCFSTVIPKPRIEP